MKSNTLFRDQVNYLNSWFEKWSECEKTVVVYGLLKHLNATQIKFLAQALQQKDCSEAEVLEAEANNPGHYIMQYYIYIFCAEQQLVIVIRTKEFSIFYYIFFKLSQFITFSSVKYQVLSIRFTGSYFHTDNIKCVLLNCDVTSCITCSV